MELKVAAFLWSKGIVQNLDDIEAWGLLTGNTLLKQGKSLKGTNVYINNHLTRKKITRKARYLRKQNKIQRTWVNSTEHLRRIRFWLRKYWGARLRTLQWCKTVYVRTYIMASRHIHLHQLVTLSYIKGFWTIYTWNGTHLIIRRSEVARRENLGLVLWWDLQEERRSTMMLNSSSFFWTS